MRTFSQQLHPSWKRELAGHLDILEEIERSLDQRTYSPHQDLVMRAFSQDLSVVRVVIFGQDPYPDPESTTGLAFAIPSQAKKIPASLKNILREAGDDIGPNELRTQDLSLWTSQGVLLLNRTLTIGGTSSNSHKDIGWLDFTQAVARILGQRGVVAILWGKNAQELSSFFPSSHRIEGVHPSPLSAYRGFFQSKPFSRANEILVRSGLAAINW
jgi:uracil-DNA glycosylase